MTPRLSLSLVLAGALASAPVALAAQPPAAPRAPRVDSTRPRPPMPGRRGAGPMPGARGLAGPGMPGGRGMAGMPGRIGGDPASLFLAHTGDLKLTDQQVTRLAAIARRASDRRTAMRPRVDSLRAGARPPAPNPADVQRLREQSHAELRDAIAVLTADQQATAWEMMRGRPFGR